MAPHTVQPATHRAKFIGRECKIEPIMAPSITTPAQPPATMTSVVPSIGPMASRVVLSPLLPPRAAADEIRWASGCGHCRSPRRVWRRSDERRSNRPASGLLRPILPLVSLHLADRYRAGLHWSVPP